MNDKNMVAHLRMISQDEQHQECAVAKWFLRDVADRLERLSKEKYA